MKSQAKTVAAYLDALPDDRRTASKTLRALIKKTVPQASEGMKYGMPTYTQDEVLYAFASQKNYMALYICAGNVVNAHRKELGKLSCGEACIRFRKRFLQLRQISAGSSTPPYNRRRRESCGAQSVAERGIHARPARGLGNENGIARIEMDARDRDPFHARRNGAGFEKPASNSRPAIAGWLRI